MIANKKWDMNEYAGIPIGVFFLVMSFLLFGRF